MPYQEIELLPVDFVTIGTVGPKGRRQFNLQAGRDQQVITLILEKEQARRLGEAIEEMLDDLKSRNPLNPERSVNMRNYDMALREPLEPMFRIAEMGLGYDEVQDLVILVLQELVNLNPTDDPESVRPSVARLWGTREQFRALSFHIRDVVEQGRADPRRNGHIINYWN